MRIRYEDHASETIIFAAAELSDYLTRMVEGLPESWEICLAGRGGRMDDGHDSYRVEIGVNGGIISGENDRSVLLAVYDYLHYLGCRFLMPGKDCEIVPRIHVKTLSASYEKQASYPHRGVCIEGADSFENVRDYIEWLPKIGFNSFFFQFMTPYAFLERWYSHEENPYATKESYTPEDAMRDMVLLEQEAKKRGLLVHKAGHGWTGEVLGYQTVSWDIQTAGTGEVYAHQMAMINGKRELFRGIPADTNLCYHNSDAVDAFASLVVTYARQNPGTDFLHVWLADEYNNLCECPDCIDKRLADQYLALLNEIDRRLTAEGLHTRIVFLLYQELLWPPIEESLENPDRFVLMFAPISRTFEKSYELETAGGNLPRFVRNRVTLPTNLSENLAFLREWQGVYDGDSFVYDYPLGRAHYGDFGYIHIARVIHSDIRKLHQMNLNGYISCQELRAALPNALPNYVMGYTLMEQGLPVEHIIEEYFLACYGTSAKRVLEYLERLSALSSSDYVNGKGARYNSVIAERMEKIMQCCEKFEEEFACHKGEDGRWESIYWKLLAYHGIYVRLLSDALRSLALGKIEQADQKWCVMREFICRHEPEYQPFLDVYRILEVTKKYTGFHG